MTKPRLTQPGPTDLEWMQVVCTPENTHVEFHETEGEAAEAALANLATSTSVYVGKVTEHGEHRTRSDSKVVILELRVDQELHDALRWVAGLARDTPRMNYNIGRKGLTKLLMGHVESMLSAFREQYRTRLEAAVTTKKKSWPGPWAKCRTVDECEAMGRCCNGCQGRL